MQQALMAVKKEWIWSNVKETKYLRHKRTKNIHLGVATRSSTGGKPTPCSKPQMAVKKRTDMEQCQGDNILSLKGTKNIHLGIATRSSAGGKPAQCSKTTPNHQ